MALTQDEYAELRRMEAATRELRAKKTAEAKAAGREFRRARSKALVRTPGQRHERERNPAYLAFVRRCGCVAGQITGDPCEGPIDAMHQRFTDPKAGRVNPGMGRKPDDRWALGGCRKHHTQQHAGNERSFWSSFVGADPTDLARELFAAFEANEDGAAVVRRFIPTRTPGSLLAMFDLPPNKQPPGAER